MGLNTRPPMLGRNLAPKVITWRYEGDLFRVSVVSELGASSTACRGKAVHV
jgi:hypothetical protein